MRTRLAATLSGRRRPTHRAVALGLACAALSFGLAGCSSSPTTAAEDVPTVDTAVDLPAAPPRVTVTDDGMSPRKIIGFRPPTAPATPGTSFTEQVWVWNGFDQKVVHSDEISPEPRISGNFAKVMLTLTGSERFLGDGASTGARGEATSPEPDRTITWVVTSASTSQPGATDALHRTRGFTFSCDTNSTGRVFTWRLGAPDTAPDVGRAAVEQAVMAVASLPVVFPATPIGPGAVWTVESPVTGDSAMRQTLTYTFHGTDPTTGRMNLGVSVERTPALGALSFDGVPGAEAIVGGVTRLSPSESFPTAQPLDTPAELATTRAAQNDANELPAATAAEMPELAVLSAKTLSRGEISVDPARPLPVAGQVSLTTRVIYGQAGSRVRVVQDSMSSVAFNPEGVPSSPEKN